MSNMCTWKKPASWTDTDGHWAGVHGSNYQLAYSSGGYKNPSTLAIAANSATTTAYYFDADEFNIVCTSFPSASGSTDPLVSQAAAITLLNTSVANMQSQVTAIASIASASSPGFDQRIADMSVVWSLFFGACIVVAAAKGIQKLFNTGPHHEG